MNDNNNALISLYMNICREQISSINNMATEISSINHNLFTVLRDSLNNDDRPRRNRNRRGTRRRFSPRQIPSSSNIPPPPAFPPPPNYPPPPSHPPPTQDSINNIFSPTQQNTFNPFTNQRRYTNRILNPTNDTILNPNNNTTNTTNTIQSNLRDLWSNIDNSLSRNNTTNTTNTNSLTNMQPFTFGRRRERQRFWHTTRPGLRNTNWTVNNDNGTNNWTINVDERRNPRDILNWTLQNYNPIRIRPSVAQVRRSTRIMLYNQLDSSRNQTICPITRENFTPNTSIMQIIPCGHIFTELSLRRHFRFSSRCPLCRYDIRDYIDSSSNNTNSNNTNSNTILQNTVTTDISNSRARNFVNNLNSTISSVIRNSGILNTLAEEDPSRNIVNNGDSLEIQYSFYIPQNLTESDISGSLVTSSEVYDVSVRLDGSNNVIDYRINDISGN